MFGRERSPRIDVETLLLEARRSAPPEPEQPRGRFTLSRADRGPFDGDEVPDDPPGQRLDFGSLRIAVPPHAQLQVEDGAGELLRAVHFLVPHGRVSLSALAAPRSAPLWRELAKEIAASLESEGARVRTEWGRWGPEVQAGSKGALSRFVGVDGPRWMLYGVATGPEAGAASLAETLRELIEDTVVVRGIEALPVKTVLPLRLPEHLAERAEPSEQRLGTTAEVDGRAPVPPTSVPEQASSPAMERDEPTMILPNAALPNTALPNAALPAAHRPVPPPRAVVPPPLRQPSPPPPVRQPSPPPRDDTDPDDQQPALSQLGGSPWSWSELDVCQPPDPDERPGRHRRPD